MPEELLLEIGAEEIPSGFIRPALAAMADVAVRELDFLRISHGDAVTMGTPRRLVLSVKDVAEKQAGVETEIVGPPVKVAFGADGRPTKAAEGFARKVGVRLEDLQTKETERGPYVVCRKREEGRPSEELLPEVLKKIVLSIPFPKSMRWGDGDVRFARPIRWIVALFGGETVSFSVGKVRSGYESRGHRFTHPGPFRVRDLQSLVEGLRERDVILDPAERKEVLLNRLEKAAADAGGQLLQDPDLLEEVTFLVEFPGVIAGSFDEDFLALPEEVVKAAMREHQRYFAVVGRDGRLLPRFLSASNTPRPDAEAVRRGNERVLKARLADAEFYFREDLKVPLERRVEDLKGVIFQTDLGTSYEKVERIRRLAAYLAEKVAPEKKEVIDRAALLCKADLVTGMVGEFPSLQGVVGREYALRSGEPEEVATAIYEHYLPVSAGDRLPEGVAGAVIGVADRMDTVAGCFGVGLVPSGTSDPFGLRRHTIAVLRILLDRGWRLSLWDLAEYALRLLEDRLKRKRDEALSDIEDFFRGRLYNMLVPDKFSHDIAAAVIERFGQDPVDAVKRMEALASMKNEEDFERLAIGFKRVINIMKGLNPEGGPDPSLFEDGVEDELYNTFRTVNEEVENRIAEGEYLEALKRMVALREPIDNFFGDAEKKGVLVLTDDEKLRRNRLALLKEIRDLFSSLADFSKIEG